MRTSHTRTRTIVAAFSLAILVTMIFAFAPMRPVAAARGRWLHA